MANITFITNSGETIARELLILYLNTGTASAPVWHAIGKRVEDSSMEFDWSDESSQDILGNTFTTMKKPIITESFDPCPLDAGDEAQLKIWNLAVVEQNAQALTNMDLLLVHAYAGASNAFFAERYPTSMVKPTGLGGEGGGNVGMPIDVTFGGERKTGTATIADGVVTFAEAE